MPKKIKTSDIRFTDHTSKTARMTFTHVEDTPIPSILDFGVYFTHHPQVPPDDLGLRFFHDHIVSASGFVRPLCLDIYFLPNAPVEDCIDHYHGKKDARGDLRCCAA